MAQMVQPKVFLTGYTTADMEGIKEYLLYTGQEEFLRDWQKAMADGIHPGEALCSLYAKLCYKSLVVDGRNQNVSKIRDIGNNICGAFDQGHGSVFEHCQLNFIVTDCSRVYTHEQVRHRQGWAYSQTSGRYCRGDKIDVILDAITKPVNDEIMVYISGLEQEYAHWCNRMGLNGLKGLNDAMSKEQTPGNWIAPDMQILLAEANRLGMRELKPGKGQVASDLPHFRGVPEWEHDFDRKKKITSALRRPLPNGQSNEIGMSVNIRALRHVMLLRTNRAAEWEIRFIFNQVYDLVAEKFPMIWHGAKASVYDGLREISGMKMQPYEIEAGDPEALKFYTVSELSAEQARRQHVSA